MLTKKIFKILNPVILSALILGISFVVMRTTKEDNASADIVGHTIQVETLSVANFFAITATVLSVSGGAIGIVVYIIKLTNAINEMKTGLEREVNKLKESLGDKIYENKQQLTSVANKFEISFVESNSHQLGLEKDIVALQKEINLIFQSFEQRLKRIENNQEIKLGKSTQE